CCRPGSLAVPEKVAVQGQGEALGGQVIEDGDGIGVGREKALGRVTLSPPGDRLERERSAASAAGNPTINPDRSWKRWHGEAPSCCRSGAGFTAMRPALRRLTVGCSLVTKT